MEYQVADSHAAIALMDTLLQERLDAGWINVDAPEADPQGMPSRFPAVPALAAQDFSPYLGRRCSVLLVELPLEFDEPNILRSRLQSWHQLGDWLNRKAWPKGFVPLAIPRAESDEDEARYLDANPSETEEFFCVDSASELLPVYLWSVDTGFKQRYPSLEQFLAELS